MISYLVKILTLLSFSFYIIYHYYFKYTFHIENFDGYFIYTLIVWFIYIIYKSVQLLTWKDKVVFTPLSILWYFLLHLFVLCWLFFSYNWLSFGSWFILFFKILFFSVLPILIIFISIWFWLKLIWYIKNIDEETSIFNFLLSLWIWFSSFLFFLSILWLIWFYNIYSFLFILIFLSIFSYKEIISLFKWLFSYKIFFNNHLVEDNSIIKRIAPNLLTTEFLFIIATLLLSVNLISIIRPFPIWWDDLGVYMNFPNLLANLWVIEGLWWFISWQALTWIWFMFKSSTQAFFLNNIWGFSSFIVLVLVTSDLLKNKKQTFINIPLLAWTIFMSLPMVIFQQAKDMKLDTGLFFITVIAIYLFLKLVNSFSIKKNKFSFKNIMNDFIGKKEDNDFLNKDLIILFIIWVIAWTAFTIKITSVLLIFWLIWVLFFYKYWFSAFLWFISILFALFTKLWIWDYMNVSYPKDDSALINYTFLALLTVWFILLFNVYKKWWDNFLSLFIKIIVFSLWIIVIISPWAIKNIYDSYPDVSIWSIISWKSKGFKIDYTKIYSESKIKEIEIRTSQKLMTGSWKTKNEDLWRYFWYENWVNNYVKLPWNLTMQKNQSWEFTDISFLFLALLPALLLFLPYKNRYYSYGVLFLLLLEILVFVFWYFSWLMSTLTLPWWYIFILWLFILFTSYFVFTLKNDNNLTNIFKINLIFSFTYIFLWTISAFWIVWYGIWMYFCFILIIVLWSYYVSCYDENKMSDKEILIKLIWSFVLFFIISIYFFSSTFPHAFKNLKWASYSSYKIWDISQDEAIFTYHREYLPMLFSLNIKNELSQEFILSQLENRKIEQITKIKKLVKDNNLWIVHFVWLVKQLHDNSTDLNEKRELKLIERSTYNWIIRPSDKFKNVKITYRIWTFLKYFISENNKRIFSDDLITHFDNYIFDEDLDKTVENIKKLWLSYFLVDLNAATIDKDPRHELTKRYEKLLYTFTSDKLELVETDSICLNIALETYKKSTKTEKDYSDYLILAGVNYESYLDNNKVIPRWNKLKYCYDYIINLVDNWKINSSNYSYLLWLRDYMVNNNIKTKGEKYDLLQKAVTHWYKTLFKVK